MPEEEKELREAAELYMSEGQAILMIVPMTAQQEKETIDAIAFALARDREEREGEIKRLKQWVDDLQSGMYVNCVYCGYRYGPKEDTPVSMADILKEHVEQCPEHPMSKLKKKIERLSNI